ncbi:MAG: aldolase/citrate lyase family protein [Solirubrobacteraceae bacterium]|nr:aldolase/citrate lyase family protein [Solirubrobacteraceae bacterium]
MPGPHRLPDHALRAIDEALEPLDAWIARRWPGGALLAQPSHTVYVPAHLARPGLCATWGGLALAALDEHAPTPLALAGALELDPAEVEDAWPLLRRVLEQTPIQDLRIDLEDGYGPHTDAEEDEHVDLAATVLVAEAAASTGPRRLGIRHRSFDASTRHRAIRTLDRLIGRIATELGGLPDGFVVTMPKVLHVDQVRVYVELLSALEQAHGLPAGSLRFEIQVETPQTILAADGSASLPAMIDAGGGRVTGLHYGTYDYSAALGVSAEHQRSDHPVAQTAKAAMRLAAAQTGVEVSDGSTNKLPVGDTATVHAHWKVHAELVAAALADGIRQGWDLHPAQLVTRHLVTIVTQRRRLPDATRRLRTYLANDLTAATVDEPATAQALAADVLRAVHCGAVDGAEIAQLTGASPSELQAMANRRVV